MPYIEPNARTKFLKWEEELSKLQINSPGELNYCVTRLFQRYLAQHEMMYVTLNDIVGAGHSAITEFQRRVVADYEQEKKIKNGDVY